LALSLVVLFVWMFLMSGEKGGTPSQVMKTEVAQADNPPEPRVHETTRQEQNPPEPTKSERVENVGQSEPKKIPDAMAVEKQPVEQPQPVLNDVERPENINPDMSDVIVEGVGWGQCRIDATRESLMNAFGRPDNDLADKYFEWKSKFDVQCWLGDSNFVKEIHFNKGFTGKTVAGIGIGSPLMKVIKAYGEPINKDNKNNTLRLDWPSRGLVIWLLSDRVRQIVVYKPDNGVPVPKNRFNVRKEQFTLNLPSGDIFDSRIFDINLTAVKNNLKDKLENLEKNKARAEYAVLLNSPNLKTHALADIDESNGKLNGVCLSFNQAEVPIVYANYTGDKLNGIVKTWNENGQREYWCQYKNDVRHGFCCYFKDDIPRILYEISHNKIIAVHLCNNNQLEKSFKSCAEAAANDENAKVLIAETDEVELEIKRYDREYTKLMDRFRNFKRGEMNKMKINDILNNMKQRDIMEQQNNEEIKRRAAGGR
jgi:hypothetical protein